MIIITKHQNILRKNTKTRESLSQTLCWCLPGYRRASPELHNNLHNHDRSPTPTWPPPPPPSSSWPLLGQPGQVFGWVGRERQSPAIYKILIKKTKLFLYFERRSWFWLNNWSSAVESHHIQHTYIQVTESGKEYANLPRRNEGREKKGKKKGRENKGRKKGRKENRGTIHTNSLGKKDRRNNIFRLRVMKWLDRTGKAAPAHGEVGGRKWTLTHTLCVQGRGRLLS